MLDRHATEISLYGHQPEHCFHRYYAPYGYLSLSVFAGDEPLGVRLGPSKQDASARALTKLKRTVGQLTSRWPGVRTVLRADPSFCREEIMTWCEAEQLDSVRGLVGSKRLCRMIEVSMEQARHLQESGGKPVSFFTVFAYRT